MQLPSVFRLQIGAFVCNESGRIHWTRKDAARRGSCLWPPLSPDLMHLDVSLFGCVPCLPDSVYTLRLGGTLRIFFARFGQNWPTVGAYAVRTLGRTESLLYCRTNLSYVYFLASFLCFMWGRHLNYLNTDSAPIKFLMHT